MKLKLRWYDCFFIFLFIYLFVLQILAIWPFTIDDMYISLRYAKNWASGNGLLWNVHAPSVEGYSNFSFVVLGMLILLFNGNPVIFLKIVGVFGLFFTCCFIYLITRFWFPQRKSLLPCLALLFYKGQIIWTASGLETAVYEALISGSVYFCLRGMGYQLFPHNRGKPKPSSFILTGLLLALAGMTRPEAPVLMLLLLILIYFDRPKTELSYYWNGVFLSCLMLMIFYIPYFVWRFFYFGYLFPNSVYCKGIAQVFTFSLDRAYLKLIWPFALLALPACLKAQDKRHYFLWLPSLVYLLMLADSDPVVAFDNRLFLPAFILLLPLVLQGIDTIVFWFLQNRSIGEFFFYFFFFWTVFFFIPGMTLADYRYFSENPVKGEELRGKVLSWLKTYTAPGDVIVLADSGMIPYHSDLNFIDSYCLNNVSMAHYNAKQRYQQFCQELLYEKPAVIILTSLIKGKRIHYTPADKCLKKMLDKQKDYKFQHAFVGNASDSTYRYELYIRMLND
ncbi:protein LphB [Legionella sp.]|uniref:protein LphB n=1 Tax=Legionella sp. TaxID=459 RepID=UPI003CB66FC4